MTTNIELKSPWWLKKKTLCIKIVTKTYIFVLPFACEQRSLIPHVVFTIYFMYSLLYLLSLLKLEYYDELQSVA